VRLTNGNALAGRLLKSAVDTGVVLWNSASIENLHKEGNAVLGAEVRKDGRTLLIKTRKGVVLACGGFPHDQERRKKLFPHALHHSPAPRGNVGDGLRLAQRAGGLIDETLPNAAAWVPVSQVAREDGSVGLFPHFIDRAKPGVIAVTRKGRRFVNEANSYHDFVQALMKEVPDDREMSAWLVTDHRAIRAYGLGFVKPRPLPLVPHLKSGYLLRGASFEELAAKMGVEKEPFLKTLDEYNNNAASGRDPVFGKGSTAYNRFYGDTEILPNPCVAPIVAAPFYAVKVVIGDLGTYAGIVTNGSAQVLDENKRPIPGLYAAGNDALSIMGGNYPGPGITLGPAMTFGWIAGRHLAGWST
jgi:succinate dehydrogenase/fumarate reductase flavoprotein subunit